VSTALSVPTGEVPHAAPDPSTAPFWEGCTQGVLRYQRCVQCGTAAFPPTPTCRHCLSIELDWQTSSGVGRLYSWTVAWRPATPAFPTPYAPAIVDMAEGFQLVSNLVDCVVEELTVDLPVTAVFRAVGELTLAYFTPIRSGTGPSEPAEAGS
jgi:uncharacterized OB-fold protein